MGAWREGTEGYGEGNVKHRCEHLQTWKWFLQPYHYLEDMILRTCSLLVRAPDAEPIVTSLYKSTRLFFNLFDGVSIPTDDTTFKFFSDLYDFFFFSISCSASFIAPPPSGENGEVFLSPLGWGVCVLRVVTLTVQAKL